MVLIRTKNFPAYAAVSPGFEPAAIVAGAPLADAPTVGLEEVVRASSRSASARDHSACSRAACPLGIRREALVYGRAQQLGKRGIPR